jgi:hypothetical protein
VRRIELEDEHVIDVVLFPYIGTQAEKDPLISIFGKCDFKKERQKRV